jgi:hypothetical protein
MPTQGELIDVSVEVEADASGGSHRYAIKISGALLCLTPTTRWRRTDISQSACPAAAVSWW